MLRALAVVAVVVLIGVAAVLAYASTRPDTFRFQRSIAVKAPADQIFPLIADFHRWTEWSPYEHRDPQLQRTYGGAPSGVGATYAWEGNRNVGSGHMQIVKTAVPSRIEIDLEFLKPFKAKNIAEFTLQPQGDATQVTWAMHGPNLFIGKVMSLFINMDKMVGKDFADGLSNLKALAERKQLRAKGGQ